jgi:hypothetical protein
VAAFRLSDWTVRRLPGARVLVTAALAVCLVLSLLVVFPSPYIYKTSSQVTEQEMRGYGTAFEHRAGDVPMATMSSRPTRYADGLYGVYGSGVTNYTGSGDGLVRPFDFNTEDFPSAYPDQPYYLILTRSDLVTELQVYRQLNFERSAVLGLDADRRANRVLANGELRLFVVSNATG